MNWNMIGAVSEILAAIGVVVSLVYLATQIRMSRVETRHASIDRLVEMWAGCIGAVADNPNLAAIMVKAFNDPDTLDAIERARFFAHMGRVLRVVEAIYMHHREDTVDPDLWSGIDASNADVLRMDATQQYWQIRKHWYSNQFRDYVDARTANMAAIDFYPEKQISEN